MSLNGSDLPRLPKKVTSVFEIRARKTGVRGMKGLVDMLPGMVTSSV